MKNQIAYILNSFPRTSETFIYNEILHLNNLNCTTKIFALSQPKEKLLYDPDILNKLKIVYLNLIGKREKILSGLILFISSPYRFVNSLLRLNFRDNPDLWFLIGQCFFLSVKFKKENIQHIHSHFASVASEIAMYVSFFTGIPFSFTTHGFDVFFSPPKNYRYRTYYSKFVVAVSKYNKQYLINKHHLPGKKLKVIYSGIDTNLFKRTNQGKRDYILCIARLEPVKGLTYLIEACNILTKRGLRVKCLIIGEGSERKKLEMMISNYKLDKIVFLEGAKSQGEVIEYLQRALVMVLPSISESMGVVNMEALSYEVPVIATDVRGVKELVHHNVNGFLVPPKNSSLLAKYIERLIENEALIETMGRAGRQIILERFDINLQISNLYNLFIR